MSHENLMYTESHEWLDPQGDVRTVGITDHAQHMLGDIVFVELPQVGRKVSKGEEIVVVESPKAAADVYAPVSGEIVAVNSDLENEPSLINRSPFGDGWLFRIRPSDSSELESLLSHADYLKIVEG